MGYSDQGSDMMQRTIDHRGYVAGVKFDPRDGIFVGRVLGVPESITFHGKTESDLTRDFHAAIDHFVADTKTRIPS